MFELLPLFVNLSGRRVLLVGGGPVAAAKLRQLHAAGASVQVVAPEIHPDITSRASSGVAIERREFRANDLDGVWLVVAAAPPEVNRIVAQEAGARQLFVNAVDDPMNATAFLSGVIRRDGVTVAISTSGDAPGLTALIREALDHLLPEDLGTWMETARAQRMAWKRDRVPMGDRRPLLLGALNKLYGMPGQATTNEGLGAPKHRRCEGGHVSLVGAGPGDPGLLTRLAVARLRRADLVLYDALVDERVLKLARHAQRFFVGKRAGRHTLSQHDIHAAMIAAARRGRRVVRLKGGDPFVFGRGGEEAVALANAGIAFDIVPGVTSAVAAPALAGIPVTHRGLASGFMVVSGHDEDAFAASVDGVSTTGVTLVVLMGLARRADLAGILLKHGWSPALPAALIAEASTARQEVWRGSLETLAAGGAQVASDGPALFVVGDVAAMAFVGEAARADEDDESAVRRGGV
jgi:uroporphyrin-III C-methyltransferase/precorrin-2 dehydrogenase/sirohydrochlorin ferrochelatase